jgi:hypothetical protein
MTNTGPSASSMSSSLKYHSSSTSSELVTSTDSVSVSPALTDRSVSLLRISGTGWA